MDFLAPILARPDDDAPRLVYSDWLADRGDPRGELMALQVAMARGEVRADAHRRAAELAQACWPAWTEVLGQAPVERFCVRRGFVEAVAFEARHLDELPALMEVSPVRDLDVHITPGDRDAIAALSDLPILNRLEALRISGSGIGTRGCVTLFRSRNLGNLRTLALSGQALTPPAAHAVAGAASRLLSLAHLHMDANRLGREGIEAIIQSPLFPQLDSLFVQRNRLEDDAAVALVGARQLASLRRLGIDSRAPAISRAMVAALIASPCADRLERLVLPWSRVPDRLRRSFSGRLFLGGAPLPAEGIWFSSRV